MRRSKAVTAVGALTVAAGAIVGGAFITSGAMASGTTPNPGSGIVVLVNEGEPDGIVCVYTDMHDIEPFAVEAHERDFVIDAGVAAVEGGVMEEVAINASDADHADWPGASYGDLGDVPGDVVHAQARPGTADECGAAREEFFAP